MVSNSENLCDYGCGKEFKFILNNGKKCCSKYSASCEELRRKNSESLKLAHKRKPGKWYNGEGAYGPASKKWIEENPEKYKKILEKRRITYDKNFKDNKFCGSFFGKHHSKETKQKISNKMSECNNGIIRTKYYEVYNQHFDKIIKVQGSWEYKYALYLNKKGVQWIRSRKIFLNYKLFEDDYIHKYYPDFYLPESDTYIEVKGYMWKSADGRVDDERKLFHVLENNKDKNIIILRLKDLRRLGILKK